MTPDDHGTEPADVDGDVVDPIDVPAAISGERANATEARVEAALRSVVDPCSATNGSNLDVVEMGLVDSIDAADGTVEVALLLTTPACDMVAYSHEEIESRVGALAGVESVEVSTDHGFEWTGDMMTDDAQRRREAAMAAYAARHREQRESD